MFQPDVASVVDLQISDCHGWMHIHQPQDGIWHAEAPQTYLAREGMRLALLRKTSTASAACLLFKGNSFKLYDPIFIDQLNLLGRLWQVFQILHCFKRPSNSRGSETLRSRATCIYSAINFKNWKRVFKDFKIVKRRESILSGPAKSEGYALK